MRDRLRLAAYGPRRPRTVARRALRQGLRLSCFLRCALPAAAGNSKADSRHALKLADHGKQVIRARISLGTEHAHQALGRRACRLRQLLKSHGRVDIVTENRFTDLNLASNELLHGFDQKRFTKRYIAFSADLYGLLEVSG